MALFLKPGSERPLLATLTDAQPDAAWPPSDAENAACCACCVPDEEAAAAADADDTWVGCDLCDAWFHAPCVRVPEAQVEELASFHCPRCCARQGSAYAFGTPPPPLKRTRRPPLAKVQQLTAEAATLPLAAAEVEGVLALQREADVSPERRRPHCSASRGSTSGRHSITKVSALDYKLGRSRAWTRKEISSTLRTCCTTACQWT